MLKRRKKRTDIWMRLWSTVRSPFLHKKCSISVGSICSFWVLKKQAICASGDDYCSLCDFIYTRHSSYHRRLRCDKLQSPRMCHWSVCIKPCIQGGYYVHKSRRVTAKAVVSLTSWSDRKCLKSGSCRQKVEQQTSPHHRFFHVNGLICSPALQQHPLIAEKSVCGNWNLHGYFYLIYTVFSHNKYYAQL